MKQKTLLFFSLFSLLFVTTALKANTSYHLDSGISETVPSSSSDFFYLPGEIINSDTDQYKIIEILGEGAFGKVYAVENSKNQKFALKCYKKSLFSQSTIFSDSEREFTNGQLLDHPNIIKTVEFFTYKNLLGQLSDNLILEYVSGQPLGKFKSSIIKQEISFELLFQCLDALNYALSFDLMHIDLHSYNVMLSTENCLKIIDLASFITYNELQNFFKSLSYQISPNYYSISDKVLSLHKKCEQTQESQSTQIRQGKIHQFFLLNPILFKQLQAATVQHTYSTPLFKLSTAFSNEIVKTKDDFRFFYQNHYFDMLTDLCLHILKISAIPREQRVTMRAEIKKIFWNYLEDLEENPETELLPFMESLSTYLSTFKSK